MLLLKNNNTILYQQIKKHFINDHEEDLTFICQDKLVKPFL